MIPKEEQIELSKLIIIEDDLNKSLQLMNEADARLDGFEHKRSLVEESNRIAKLHWIKIMDLYDVLLDPNMRGHVDKDSFPLIYKYMIALERSKGF